ncbi:TPA: hypothetical protein DCX16_05430 [bacterium]|nr:hypothetical protein [bacterium]
MKKGKAKKKRKSLWELFHPYIIIFSILFISFIIRLGVLSDIEKQGWLDLQLTEGTDMTTFDSEAQRILKGEKVEWHGTTSVLYPVFIAFVYLLFGRDLHPVYIAQIIFALISYFLLYLIGKKLFNKTVGIIILILACFYGPFILYEDSLLLDGCFAFSIPVIFYLILRMQEAPSPKKAFLLGLSIGITALFKGTIFTYLPFVFIVLLIHTGFKKIIPLFLPLCFGVYLPIFPVTVKNFIDTREFIPLSAKGGIHFYIANNPGSTGHSDSYPEDYLEIAERINVCKSSSKRSKLWVEEALKFIKTSPKAWSGLILKKAYLYWDKWEIPNNVDYVHFKGLSGIMKLPIFPDFSIIAPLGLLGLLLTIRKKTCLFISFFILSHFLTITFCTLILSRYRVSVVPALLIFSGYSLFYLYTKFKENGIKHIIAPIFLLFIFYICVNSSFFIKPFVYKLIYKDGIQIKKEGKYLWVMDAPEEGFSRETINLDNPIKVVKKELIISDITKVESCILFFDYFGEGGIIHLTINDIPLGTCPCPNTKGLLIFGKTSIPLNLLRSGTNTFALKALSGRFEIPLEKTLCYGRSYFSGDGGDTWEKKKKGEYTMRLKMEMKNL